MSEIPKDPMILLSFINMNLRDRYPSMEELCKSMGIEKSIIDEKLNALDYVYDGEQNRYV